MCIYICVSLNVSLVYLSFRKVLEAMYSDYDLNKNNSVFKSDTLAVENRTYDLQIKYVRLFQPR
jgi:hypothetical protein